MANLESQLTGNNINTWLAANSAAMTGSTGPQVALSLPKFTFKTSYDLSSTLSSMGMTLAFTPPGPTTVTGANFWNIDGTNNLYITEVVHQAYVDVDETGTTAAAATGVVLCPGCMAVMMPLPPIPFIVNRPFVFMIVDNTSNTVLFMGRVNDPLSTN
jgi:serpin B